MNYLAHQLIIIRFIQQNLIKVKSQYLIFHILIAHTPYLHIFILLKYVPGKELAQTAVRAIAYETINHGYALVEIVVGSYFLLKPNKGLGVMFGEFIGIDKRVVTVAGVAGN